MDLSYQESYAMNPKETRRKVVETYLACGSISATARQWKTSPVSYTHLTLPTICSV